MFQEVELEKDALTARFRHKAGPSFGSRWFIGGQEYRPKARNTGCFVFEVVCQPGQAIPRHLHDDQDEYIRILDGELLIAVGAVEITARSGDLMEMPRGLSHGYANLSDAPATALFWVTPAGSLAEMFEVLDGVDDAAEMGRISARFGIPIVGDPPA